MKEWTTPELIVLVRGRPEEGVLAPCKGGPREPDMLQAANPSTVFAGCAYPSSPAGSADVYRCLACESISTS